MDENGSIDPGTSMGAVRLAVADRDGVRDFYRDAIGLAEVDAEDGVVRLRADDEPIVELVGDPRPLRRRSRRSLS
jgi:catechol-2,3-dioxygenase